MMKKILISLSALLLVTLSFLVFLISPWGLETSLSLVGHFIPGTLSYEKAEGSILGPIKLSQVSFKNKKISVSAKKLYVDWSINKIFQKEIQFNYIKGNDIKTNINYDTAKLISQQLDHSSTSSTEDNEKKLKYKISIKKAHLENVDFLVNNQHVVTIKSLNTHTEISNKNIMMDLISEFYEPVKTELQIHLKGLLKKYIFTTNISNKYSQWEATGTGNLKSAQFKTIKSKLLQGELTGHGSLNWVKKKWGVTIEGKKINFSILNKNLPKSLSLNIKSNGNQYTLKDLKYNASGEITSPDNKIKFEIEKEKTLKANWDAHLNNLTTLFKKISGDITSEGTINQIQENYQTKGTFNSNILKYNDSEIKNGKGNWKINKSSGVIKLHLDKLNWKAVKLNNINSDVTGDLKSHKINISATANHNTLLIQSQGSKTDQSLNETIDHFELKNNRKTYSNTQPIKIVYQNERLTIPHNCLINRNDKLCFSLSHHEKNWHAFITTQHFPTNLLLPVYHPDILLSNPYIDLKASFSGPEKSLTQFNINAKIKKGTLTYYYNSLPYSIKFNNIGLISKLNDQSFSTENNIELNKTNYINTTLHVSNFHTNNIQNIHSHLQGTIDISIPDLELYNNLIPQSKIHRGNLKSDLYLSGNTQNPEINGDLNLTQGNITFPLFGTQINEITSKIKEKDYILSTNSSISIRNKKLLIKTKSDLKKEGFPTQGSINGENILFAKTPLYEFTITPFLNLSHQFNSTIISGEINFNNSFLDLSTFTHTTQLPYSDITFTDSTGSSKSKHGNDFALNVGLNILNNNRIIGYGLKTHITGDIQLSHSNHKPYTASGQINFPKGTFAAYGHTLELLPESNIYYTGDNSPVTNPQLNVQATKTINTTSSTNNPIPIKVQIGVTGSLKNRIIKLSSIPSNLTQSQILSLLLFGYAYNNDANNPGLLKAVGAIQIAESGIQSSGGIASALRNSLGLNELGINQQAEIDAIGNSIQNNNSQFIIGKYLNKRTYIRYLRDITGINPTQELQLKFLLNNHFSLRVYDRFAISPSLRSQGLDIIFSKSNQ
jgi:autotransporter translocation and assembly factor TamB